MTFYAVHLVWIPITGGVALVLGMVAYTARVMWKGFFGE